MQTDVNVYATDEIATALAHGAATNAEQQRQAGDFVTSRGPSNSAGYVQSTSTDVSSSAGGLPVTG